MYLKADLLQSRFARASAALKEVHGCLALQDVCARNRCGSRLRVCYKSAQNMLLCDQKDLLCMHFFERSARANKSALVEVSLYVITAYYLLDIHHSLQISLHLLFQLSPSLSHDLFQSFIHVNFCPPLGSPSSFLNFLLDSTMIIFSYSCLFYFQIYRDMLSM